MVCCSISDLNQLITEIIVELVAKVTFNDEEKVTTPGTFSPLWCSSQDPDSGITLLILMDALFYNP